VAAGGYAAALLLDGDSLLRRENLRAGEDAVRRWFNAAALVKPAREGGLVVITADDTAGVGALLRWDAGGYARRELALRQELQLPPAVRIASVTGGRTAVVHFSEAIDQQLARQGINLRTAGPAPLVLQDARAPRREAGEDVRTLLFIPYAQAAEATRVMRAVKAAAAARRSDDPVQLRLDGVDVL
jgi:primosomal protein N' (replication factor Y)